MRAQQRAGGKHLVKESGRSRWVVPSCVRCRCKGLFRADVGGDVGASVATPSTATAIGVRREYRPIMISACNFHNRCGALAHGGWIVGAHSGSEGIL